MESEKKAMMKSEKKVKMEHLMKMEIVVAMRRKKVNEMMMGMRERMVSNVVQEEQLEAVVLVEVVVVEVVVVVKVLMVIVTVKVVRPEHQPGHDHFHSLRHHHCHHLHLYQLRLTVQSHPVSGRHDQDCYSNDPGKQDNTFLAGLTTVLNTGSDLEVDILPDHK